MPVIIPETLPAKSTLEKENIFVMGEQRATSQDIRALRLAILNLMPTKITTETQILRLIANTALQVEVTLLHTKSHRAKNTPAEHLLVHYASLSQVWEQKYDGLIITGAPVEHLDYEEVDYWPELQAVFDWSQTNVHSTFHICWGAQAGLYHRYNIPKHPIPAKLFGVFQHKSLVRNEKLLHGFDDLFYAPHSRHTEIRREDVERESDLVLLSESEQAGVYILASQDRRQFYITGHSEYDPLTLRAEYERDRGRGLAIHPPENYFPNNDPTREPIVQWRGHAHLLFANWLNYYVYQRTPYDIRQVPGNGRV
jgi:homoserine O-succinyltransferase